MKLITLSEMYNYNYSISVVNALRQYWHTNKNFSCINKPKINHMLFYLDGCKAEYVLKNGDKIFAKDGNIVYIPIGSEYSIRLYDFSNSKSNTVGINFFLYDENNLPFVMSDGILVLNPEDTLKYKTLFSKIDRYSENAVPCYGKMKSAMYDIISDLTLLHRINCFKKYDLIMKGILYIEESAGFPSVSEISEMCNVSTAYFRRLFKEYSGMPPIKYIINKKIEKAKIHLQYDNMNISEISEKLGFTDSAYFSKQFKYFTGLTPSEYKKQFEQ